MLSSTAKRQKNIIFTNVKIHFMDLVQNYTLQTKHLISQIRNLQSQDSTKKMLIILRICKSKVCFLKKRYAQIFYHFLLDVISKELLAHHNSNEFGIKEEDKHQGFQFLALFKSRETARLARLDKYAFSKSANTVQCTVCTFTKYLDLYCTIYYQHNLSEGRNFCEKGYSLSQCLTKTICRGVKICAKSD